MAKSSTEPSARAHDVAIPYRALCGRRFSFELLRLLLVPDDAAAAAKGSQRLSLSELHAVLGELSTLKVGSRVRHRPTGRLPMHASQRAQVLEAMDVGTAEPAETHTNGSAEALTHASLSFLQLAVQQERPPPGRAHTHASSTGQRDAAIVSHGTARGPQLLRCGGAHSTDSGLAVLSGSLARSLDAAAAGVSAGRSSTTCSRPAAGRSRTRRSHSTRSACSARRRRSTATTAVTETNRDTAPDREAAP